MRPAIMSTRIRVGEGWDSFSPSSGKSTRTKFLVEVFLHEFDAESDKLALLILVNA